MKFAHGCVTLNPGEKLPEPLAGKYAPEPDNPLVYRMVFPLCIYHDLAGKTLSCGRTFQQDHCSLKQIFISPKICHNCTVRAEHVEQRMETPSPSER